MNANSNQRKTTIIIVAIASILFIFLCILLFKTNGAPSGDISTTSITSPFTKSSIKNSVNYSGEAPTPNSNAVQTTFQIFGKNEMGSVDSRIKNAMQYSVLAYLKNNYSQDYSSESYVHLDKQSIRNQSDGSYSFNFYIDNPELYFLYESTDEGIYSIKPVALEGVQL